jgi:hypothetical protein
MSTDAVIDVNRDGDVSFLDLKDVQAVFFSHEDRQTYPQSVTCSSVAR